MEDIEKKVLGICSVCKSIRISDEPRVWLKKETDPKLYERYLKKFEGKLSHGYCPEHLEEERKKYE